MFCESSFLSFYLHGIIMYVTTFPFVSVSFDMLRWLLFLKNACYLSSMEVVSVAALIWKIYRVVKNFCVDDPELWEFFHQLWKYKNITLKLYIDIVFLSTTSITKTRSIDKNVKQKKHFISVKYVQSEQ